MLYHYVLLLNILHSYFGYNTILRSLEHEDISIQDCNFVLDQGGSYQTIFRFHNGWMTLSIETNLCTFCEYRFEKRDMVVDFVRFLRDFSPIYS